jgi:PAS domain S-box-containing protein
VGAAHEHLRIFLDADAALTRAGDTARLEAAVRECVVPSLADHLVLQIAERPPVADPRGRLRRVTETRVPEREPRWLVFPLLARGAVLGALGLARDEGRPPFGDDDAALTQALVSRVALALDGASLAREALAAHRAAARAAAHTDRLGRLTDELSTALTPAAVAEAVVGVGRAALGASAAFAWFLREQPAGTVLEMIASDGYDGDQLEPHRIIPAEVDLPLWRSVRSGLPMWIESPAALVEQYPAARAAQRSGYGRWAVAPFVVDGRGIGGVSLSFTDARPFRDDERALLAATAGQASLAFERCRLFEAEREPRTRTERAADRARRLQAAAAALSRAATSGGVAHELLRLCVEAVSAQWGVVGVLSGDGASIRLVESVGLPAVTFDRWRHVRMDSRGPMADAARLRQPVWLESAHAFAAAYPDLHASSVLHPAAMAGMPLVASGRLIGAYTLGFEQPRQFAPEERELLTALGQLCAQALDRAHVYEAERRARAALETTNAKLEAIIQASPAAITLLDPEGHIDLWNPAAERTFGWSEAEVRGRLFPGIPEEERTQAAADLVRIGRGEGALVAGREVRRYGRDGRPIDLSLWMAPVHLPDGSWRCLAVMVDITERRRVERAVREREADLEAACEHARQADRRKDEFLAILGHELRSPLRPMATALQLLKLRGEPQAQRERAVIERQIRHLQRLTDDLLDVSRITRGKVRLARERVDLAEVVAGGIEMATPLFEDRRQRLQVVVARGTLFVDGDPVRLAQVVANLLNNAAAFTPEEGEITVSAAAAGEEVVLSVRDTGVGIPGDLLPHVFELYRQAPDARPQSGGLGLGLAIVKQLIDLHGGTVEARSDGPGRGSELLIRLPAAAPPAAELPLLPRRHTDTSPRKILVVDDNREAAESLADLLASFGHQVQVACDASRALELADAFHPEVAVLDIGPASGGLARTVSMDGYDLARHLRRHATAGAIRLIALTGHGEEPDGDRAAAAGFDRQLAKPVDVALLLRLIEVSLPAPN